MIRHCGEAVVEDERDSLLAEFVIIWYLLQRSISSCDQTRLEGASKTSRDLLVLGRTKSK